MSLLLEEELARLEAALAAAEQAAKAVLSAVRTARRQATSGLVAGLPGKLAGLPGLAGPLAQALAQAARSFDYDAGRAFAKGAYLQELRVAAAAEGLVLVERDGRVTAFPLVLRLDPAVPAVRLGRRLERRLRPAVLIEQLKRAQERSSFNPEAFLELLFRAATHLARADGRAEEPRPGAVVPLIAIHELLTLRHSALADYPLEAFCVDLLRLDRAPDTRTRRGYGFSLPASTGSKGRPRLTVYDERGVEHVYVGISFRPAPARPRPAS